MKNSVPIIVMSAMLFFSFHISAQVIKSSEIIDAGVYTLDGKDSLLQQTDSIKMEMGTHFGFRFKIIGEPDNRSVMLNMQIQITDKSGNANTIQYDMKYLVHAFATGRHTFIFELPEEMVAGTWKFSILYQDDTVLEKSFEIF
ncbi:MAG: DUF3859 domain-containing protein [Chitinophagales bacterium]|nr:DUF3859 domain-containing protein [Chitinophagales bacterium]